MINESRFRADFDELAEIGATAAGGVHRPTFSEWHLAAREWFKGKVNEAGFEQRVDGAANHSGILKCDKPNAKTILLGSHLDSVPNGGRFDGALGVVTALEVARSIKESGVARKSHLEVIDFTDEEATWLPLFGSRSLMGTLSAEELSTKLEKDPEFGPVLERVGVTMEGILSAARPDHFLAYLEVHIEQGKRLATRGIPIGIVTSMVGISHQEVTFLGEANHAGTTMLEDRRDALQGASALVTGLFKAVQSEFPTCVCNAGHIQLGSDAYNIVPGRASLKIETRGDTVESAEALKDLVRRLAEDIALEQSLEVIVSDVGEVPPCPLSSEITDHIAAACEAHDLLYTRLPSLAGHDGQTLAPFTKAGMFFIPSAGGISHSPDEASRWEDCVAGAHVMETTVAKLLSLEESTSEPGAM